MENSLWRIRVLLAVVLVMAVFFPMGEGKANASQTPPETQSVLFVGNNWDGTVDIIDPKKFTKLSRINVIPDIKERERDLLTNPVALMYKLMIRKLIGEGHDQYVDDMFTSRDGRYVYVSRPSLADVVGIDLRTQEIVWRVKMEGYRSDHMAISPDGTRLLVSDSTARKVQVIDPREGRKVGEFESGDSPHESNYSPDGKRIYHASVGHVWTPTDQPIFDFTKGDRWFQIVDAKTNKIIKRLDIGKTLKEYGYKDYSSAVRPMVISPDEKTAYMQLSFFHGFLEFDLKTFKPLRLAQLPISDKAKNTPREQYILDSAHHGLAMNPKGTKLCAAGTMSDYAAIVDRGTFKYKLFPNVDKPYWATNSADGKYCFVSASGEDSVVVLNYDSEQEVTRIPVGDHPQRMRMGVIRQDYVSQLPNTEHDSDNDSKGPVPSNKSGKAH
ncbi:DNA-binding beta-propeller fold protein YncE [Marininema mesophilum]|uniref:DNA-binding beta-propeller fold protein YncE n=1 Tax=Marininema mesophilum TaxID=1048340 RepID=A0A1H3CXF4_9BACL|nr:YncE family protein [Marininema mesophilum]SDX58766.1 DNA-binding beta-propeller fold protein YncE [Marininema mesophilum]